MNKFRNLPLKLISTGIKAWVHSQCDSAEKIDLALNGSTLSLLKGELIGITLIALKLKLQGILFDSVSLKTGPIKLKVDLLKRKNKVVLNKDFEIEGDLTVNEKSLYNAIYIAKWDWLPDLLSEELLDGNPIKELTIKNGLLEIKSEFVNRAHNENHKINIKASKGTIMMENIENNKTVFLPMDPSIQVRKAQLKDNKLLVQVKSLVRPLQA